MLCSLEFRSVTVEGKKTLTKVLFGTVRYTAKVRLRYCYVTVVVLLRYCTVNVQVRYKSGGSTCTCTQCTCTLKVRYLFGNRSALVRSKLVTAFARRLRNVNFTCRIPALSYTCFLWRLVVEIEWRQYAEMSLRTKLKELQPTRPTSEFFLEDTAMFWQATQLTVRSRSVFVLSYSFLSCQLGRGGGCECSA